MENNFTKVEILSDLKNECNNAFGQLYSDYFSMVNHFIIKNSGQTSDAEDIFQDTMIVLVEKLRRDNFQLIASLKTYIMAISKNLWFKKLRTQYKELRFSDLQDSKFIENISNAIQDEINYWDILKNYIRKISNHCKGLIYDLFFKKKTIEQIQKEYGYSTKHNAQNQKHKCIEQIRKIKEKNEKNENHT